MEKPEIKKVNLETMENRSENQHIVTEKDLLTEKELKDLFDWFDGKVLRSEEY